MRVPPKRKVNTELLARQAYETLAIIAAVLPPNQNAFGAAKNCWSFFGVCPHPVSEQSVSLDWSDLLSEGDLVELLAENSQSVLE